MAINRKRSNDKQTDLNKSFLERESEANATRRKDISVLAYIKIPDELLNPTDSEFAMLCESELDELRRLSSERLLNLTIYSNTDLKLMYGPQNLDDLSKYDSNFTELELAITSLSKKCIDNNMDSLCIPYLEFAVKYKTTNSQIYVLLANRYAALGQHEKIQSLLDGLNDQDFLMKKTIVDKLTELL
ncbi:MAG: hypothetical protein K6F37_07280 [Lachnospiraceae bacterium]|nr:hypothetical protein [Lachnospiraceae bacterium]